MNKNIYHIKFLILFLVLSTELISQVNTTWTKYYGGTNSDGGYSLSQTSDGGYIIAGATASYGNGDYDVYLIKTNSTGDVSWTKTFGGSESDGAYSVRQTSDGGYIIAGYTEYSSNYNLWVIKTNSSGDLEWDKEYDGISSNAYAYEVYQTTDGGYIIAGYINTSGNSDMWLIKTNSSGTVLWDHKFLGTDDEICLAMQPTSDGGYVLCGYQLTTDSIKILLVKANSSGVLEWYKTFGEYGLYNIGTSVCQTTDGGYMITGFYNPTGASYPNLGLIKTDAAGNTQWIKTYGGSNYDGGTNVKQTTDGGYIITGYTQSFGLAGSRDIWLLRTDSQGDTTWTRTYGNDGEDYGRDIIIPEEGKYVFTGSYTSTGETYSDVILKKLEEIRLEVLIPNGGENWSVGSSHTIEWASSGINDVRIDYTTNNGSVWNNVIASTPSDGSYTWTIPNTPSINCKVRISDYNNASFFDQSNEAFTISPPASLTVTSPNGGENWSVGSSHTITWTSSGISSVRIDYTTNNGSAWNNVIASTPGDGSYDWTIPNTPSPNCKVRISDFNNALLFDLSDEAFTISSSAFITVTSPNGGENWLKGSTQTIQWSDNITENVKIDLYKGGTFNQLIVNSTQSNGTYTWTIPTVLATGSDYKIKVSSTANSSLWDASDADFGIVETAPIISFGQTAIEFGNVSISNSLQKTFNIGNAATATASLEVTDIVSDNNAFTVGATNFTLAPGENQTITVTFTPVAVTSYEGTITVTHNASGSPSQVSVSGSGIEAISYPDNIDLTTTYTFSDHTKTSSYRIVGLPALNNTPISDLVQGQYGKDNDWRAFRDPGSGDFIEYSSGSAQFNFIPGRAFWILSKNTITINLSAVPTVVLAADNTYSIPLHDGWNLISDPFEKNINWDEVISVNTGVTQPIYIFQSGSYNTSSQMEPYRGYYFNNTTGGTSLKIPYLSQGGSLSKQIIDNPQQLDITLNIQGERRSDISIGFSVNAKEGLDEYDIFSPPSTFCSIDLALCNQLLESDYKYLKKEYRTGIDKGQEFRFELKNTTGRKGELEISGLDSFGQYEVYLVDKRLNTMYNLRDKNVIEVKGSYEHADYSLLVGTKEYIGQMKSSFLPEDYVLCQNYPNPFNPSTIIRFSLINESKVTLNVYNILGELITTLIDNEYYPAGNYEVELNGKSMTSGVYLYSIQAGNFVATRKMVFIK